MKTYHRLVFPFFLTTLLFFLVAAMPRGFASAEEHANDALVASKNWIAQIDAGLYDESYDFTCGATRDKVTEDRWIDVLKALRLPWGPVLSRKQISHIYKPNGVPGLPGECMVITYDTTFQKMAPAIEEVVLKWEGGKWRGAGYNAGPKSASDETSVPPPLDSTTEIHTEPHVHPQAQ